MLRKRSESVYVRDCDKVKTMPSSESPANGKCHNGTSTYRSYKMRKSFGTRKEEVKAIRKKFPTKVPVIVEKYEKEKILPLLDKTKFLVPKEITMSQFVSIIRNRSELKSHQAFYLLINNRSITSMSKTVAQIYNEYKEDDGFLYITYASQEAFGGNDPVSVKKRMRGWSNFMLSSSLTHGIHCKMKKSSGQPYFNFKL